MGACIGKSPSIGSVVDASRVSSDRKGGAGSGGADTMVSSTHGQNQRDSVFSKSNFILDNRGQLSDGYDIDEKKIGQGSYGSVVKANHKATGLTRAVKIIGKSNVKNVERFRQEVAIMKTMDHPHIIKLHETFEDARNIYLVMELCTGGELFDRIIELGHLTEVQTAIIMQQILRAIYYMHENCVMHRDLKPENFLFLTKDPIERASLKLIDFGLSTKFGPGEVKGTKAGTPYYVAPQVLSGRYDQSCDVWSCGVIMYILLCGYPPFYGDTDAEVLAKVKSGNFQFTPTDWKNVSDDAKDLIRKLLRMNPRERFTAEQALHHVWVKNRAPKASNIPLESTHLDNLKNLRNQNKLKKAALQVIANQLPESEIEGLKRVFLAMDKNGDGQLTLQELMEGIQKSGLHTLPEELTEIMKCLDSNQSGTVDYSEFIAATLDRRKYVQEDRLWAAFKVFDVDGNGQISKQELAQVLHGGMLDAENLAAVDEIVNDIDLDGDGQISFEEFARMMRK